MGVIAQRTSVTAAGKNTLYTASSPGTVNVRVCNNGANSATITMYITTNTTSPAPADGIEYSQTLKPGQVLLEMGEVINTGESVVIDVAGTSPAISCRVSGWTE